MYLIFKRSAFLSLLLICSSTLSSRSFAGAGSSGGTNFCWLNNKPVVKDLASALPDFADQLFSKPTLAPIQISPLMRKMGIDELNLPNGQWQKEIQDRLMFLRITAPRVAYVLDQAIAGVRFLGTNEHFPRSEQAFIDPASQCNEKNVRAGVIYFQGLALVSIPELNQLSDLSIAAMVVHEALRHVQLSYLTQEDLRSSNKDLEDLTLQIFRKMPNLDTHPFISSYMERTIGNVPGSFKSFCLAGQSLLESTINQNSNEADLYFEINNICSKSDVEISKNKLKFTSVLGSVLADTDLLLSGQELDQNTWNKYYSFRKEADEFQLALVKTNIVSDDSKMLDALYSFRNSDILGPGFELARKNIGKLILIKPTDFKIRNAINQIHRDLTTEISLISKVEDQTK